METKRLAVVSNRLPVVINKEEDGQWSISPGSGGLVTAISPVLRDRGGLWIGWLGINRDEFVDMNFRSDVLAQGATQTGYTLEAVDLTEEEVQKYYFGFSNEILWPLFHDLPSRCNFDHTYWDVYERVNHKFAEVIQKHTLENDYVWIHDYHLTLVASKLRKLDSRRRIGFFLHTPFPPLRPFSRIPTEFGWSASGNVPRMNEI